MLKLTKFSINNTWNKTLRAVLISKLNLSNSFSISEFTGVNIFLVLNNLDNFDSSRLVAASFILNLISNKRPSVLKFSLFQTFKKKEYAVHLCVSLRNESMYTFLSVLTNVILPSLSKSDVKVSYSLRNLCFVASFAITDFSFIKIVETHSVFFRWRDSVNIQLFTSARTMPNLNALFSVMKILK